MKTPTYLSFTSSLLNVGLTVVNFEKLPKMSYKPWHFYPTTRMIRHFSAGPLRCRMNRVPLQYVLQKFEELRPSRVNASFPQKAPTKNLSRNICRNPQILSQIRFGTNLFSTFIFFDLTGLHFSPKTPQTSRKMMVLLIC